MTEHLSRNKTLCDWDRQLKVLLFGWSSGTLNEQIHSLLYELLKHQKETFKEIMEEFPYVEDEGQQLKTPLSFGFGTESTGSDHRWGPARDTTRKRLLSGPENLL